MTRDEKKERRALLKEVAVQMKRAAPARGWTHVGGFLFRQRLDWFIELVYGSHPDQAVTTMRLYSKPMVVDPLFWEIVGLGENAQQPLSFRAQGAWTCSAPEAAELTFDDAGLDAAALAERILSWGEAEVTAQTDGWTVEGFADAILHHPRHLEAFSWLPALTTGLILAGRPEVARDRCLAARAAGASGGFSAGERTFPDMALAWLTARSS